METLFIQTRFTMYGSETLFTQTRFTMCGIETLFTSLRCEPEAFFDKTSFDGYGGTVMVEKSQYPIRSVNDSDGVAKWLYNKFRD